MGGNERLGKVWLSVCTFPHLKKAHYQIINVPPKAALTWQVINKIEDTIKIIT